MSQIIEDSPLQAGRAAAAKHAWREAYDLLTAADRTDALTPEDLEALADSAWWSGRLDNSIAVRERAYAAYLDAGRPRTAATIATRLTMDYFSKLQQSIAMGWFRTAERLLQSEPDCVEQGYLHMVRADSALSSGDLEGALDHARATLDIGERYGNRDLQAFGLLLQGQTLVGRGQVKEGLALLDEATVAAVSGDLSPLASGIIYCVAITATTELGDYGRAGEWTEAAQRWCDRQSITGFPGICRVHRAEIMRLRGAWSEAEQETRKALNELRNFNLHVAAEAFYELGEIRLRIGDLTEAEEAFRQAHELGREPQPGLALLRLVQDKCKPASHLIRGVLDEPHLTPLARARLLPAQVTIAIATNDLERARAAADELAETIKAYGSPPLRASASMACAELQIAEGDSAAAIRNLRAARRLWKEADLPYEEARARMFLGIALHADGDEDGALLELRAARSVFERLGAVLDLRKVTEVLKEMGAEASPTVAAAWSRATKTFMFTDIVGSTTLVQAMGDEAWGNLLAWHDQIMRDLIGEHHGIEVKQVGDGFFVAFDIPSDAIECAVAIQRRLAEHRRNSGFAPPVRIGLHADEATLTGRDYAGMGVHEAARIGALAGGGEILASKAVLDAASIRFPVSDLRSVELKGVAEPVEVGSIDPA